MVESLESNISKLEMGSVLYLKDIPTDNQLTLNQFFEQVLKEEIERVKLLQTQ